MVAEKDKDKPDYLYHTHLPRPVVKEFLGVQLQTETVTVVLELLPLHVVLPAFAQDVLHATHVGVQLTLDLKVPEFTG